MLEQILQYLRNWFVIDEYHETFEIVDGIIELPFLRDGQYFRIMGSLFNDGLYRYGDNLDLTDETFDGSIWALAVPKSLILLVPEIEAWEKKYAEVIASPYTSESYAGYSYSKATASDGTATGWQSAFASRLSAWRKI